jgi:hypothetical protein
MSFAEGITTGNDVHDACEIAGNTCRTISAATRNHLLARVEVLDQTVRQLERGEASALEVGTPFAEDRGLKLPPAPTRRSHAGTCSLQGPHQHANPGTAAAPSRSAA